MTDYKDKPKWRKALINLKWSYIKLDRKLHSKLTMILIIAVLFIGYALYQELTAVTLDTSAIERDLRIATCFIKRGCLTPV